MLKICIVTLFCSIIAAANINHKQKNKTTMTFLRIYIIGTLVSFLGCVLLEHLYYGKGRGETVHLKTLFMDFLYSLSSWVGVLLLAFTWAAEWYCGFPQKGEGAFLHDYEEELKKEYGKTGRKTKK